MDSPEVTVISDIMQIVEVHAIIIKFSLNLRLALILCLPDEFEQ
jgi:hypothetical protein